MPVTVTLRYAQHAAAHHITIVDAAKIVLERVLNDDAFKQEFERADFSGGMLFKESNGKVVTKSKSEVLEIILHGLERDTDRDNDLDMTISPYPHRKGVVGSAGLGRQPIKPAIWFLEQCAKRKDAVSLARHLAHEWCHVAGFFHSKSGPGQDDVPYEVGDIVRKVAKTLPKLPGFLANEETDLMDDDDLAAYLLEEAEDEVDYPDDW